MDVLNYNIGNSSTAIARDKNQVSTMSIGGVANITAIRGYRDLNLVSNMPRYGYSSTKKEFGSIGNAVGTLYSIPSEPAQMSHGGVKGTLDNAGWLGGYLDMMAYLDASLSRNGSKTFQNESFISQHIGNVGDNIGERYENTDTNARLGIDMDKERSFRSKYGIVEYTNKYLEGFNGFNILDGYKVLNEEYNFDAYNSLLEYQTKTFGKPKDYGNLYSVPEHFSRTLLDRRNIVSMKDYSTFMGYQDSMSLLIKNRVWDNVNSAIESVTKRSAMGDLMEYYDKNDSFADALAAGDTDVLQDIRYMGLYEYSSKYREALLAKRRYDSYGIDYSTLDFDDYTASSMYFSFLDYGEGLSTVNFQKGANGSILNADQHTINTITKNAYSEGVSVSSIDTASLYRGNEVGFGSKGSSELIRKTSELFNNGSIKSIVSRFHTDKTTKASEIQSAVHNEYGMSRGRNLLAKKSNTYNGYDDPYCRVWTVHHQYSTMKDRIRPFVEDDAFMKLEDFHKSLGENMRPGNAGKRLGENSVLMDNGFIKIAPTHNSSGAYKDDIKNYMFSIENLAWRDTKITKNLSPEQRGPNGGRIMWFPPYGLSFNEFSTVNWNQNDFIGRGEKIYTYTNTERTGNLSFILLVDHPSIVNKWRGIAHLNDGEKKVTAEEDILRFFAGCDTLEGTVSGDNDTNTQISNSGLSQDEAFVGANDIVVNYVMFFPNDYTGYDDLTGIKENLKKYEYSASSTWGDLRDNKLNDEKFIVDANNNNTNSSCLLNNFLSEDCKEKIRTILGIEGKGTLLSFNTLIDDNDTVLKQYREMQDEYEIKFIDIKGHASSHGYSSINNGYLSDHRAGVMSKLIKEHFGCDDSRIIIHKSTDKDNPYSGEIQVNDTDKTKPDVNSIEAKIARSSVAQVVFKLKDKAIPSDRQNLTVALKAEEKGLLTGKVLQKPESINLIVRPIGATTADTTNNYAYDNEYLYFKNLEINDKLNYDKIVDKVQFFKPAFHSITPEGFNARLTFLQQCSRQGSTESLMEGGSAGNLAFGRAPYCVLRIGDFYHTKIVIDNVQISFDNSGGISWDMNPEGIGLQPLFAKVDIAFKFIGGQDLSGPIERLQNAVSYNYYANASVYDRHADYNVKSNSTSNDGGTRTNSEEWRFNAMEGVRKQVK